MQFLLTFPGGAVWVALPSRPAAAGLSGRISSPTPSSPLSGSVEASGLTLKTDSERLERYADDLEQQATALERQTKDLESKTMPLAPAPVTVHVQQQQQQSQERPTPDPSKPKT